MQKSGHGLTLQNGMDRGSFSTFSAVLLFVVSSLLSIFFMDESDTIHLTLDKNETRTDKTSLEKEHRKLEETSFLSNSVR